MKNWKNVTILNISALFLSLFFIKSSHAADQNIDTLHQQKAQLIKQITALKDNISNINTDKNQVMLGTQQRDLETATQVLNFTIASLSQISDAMDIYKQKQKELNVKWQPISANNSEKNNLFDANNDHSKPVYICRADFVGANVNTKATYPGQITASGCHISYAGYAFTVSNYQILSGKNNNLEWMNITEVKKLFSVPENQSPQLQQLRSLADQANSAENQYLALQRQQQLIGDGYPNSENNYRLYNLMPDTQKPLPIAGGYEGGNPVYICRAQYNGSTHVGKMVTFTGADSQTHDACDISADDKEIPIENNYELLLAKNI